MPEPTRWRKKPVVIKAMQWGVRAAAEDVINWVNANGGRAHLIYRGDDHPLRRPDELYPHSTDRAVKASAAPFLVIETLEGPHRADFHSWVIRGLVGEFYPCDPDVFTKTYEQVTDA